MQKKIIFAIIFFFIISNVIGQVFEEGRPMSFQYDIGRNIDVYDLDVQLDITQEESTVEIIGGDTVTTQDPRIGQLFGVQIDINHNGTWTQLENGDSIWRMQINSHSGRYMMLIFSEFYMPRGASLFFYSSDKKSVIGAITNIANNQYNRHSTSPIKSNSIIIEYNKPNYVTEQVKLKVEQVGLIGDSYERNYNVGFGQSGDCMINAMCTEYSNWCNQRRSVALIFIPQNNYISLCSGSLLVNERRDGKPYMLTAFHCADCDDDGELSSSEKYDIRDWVFIFNYQSSTCSNPATEPSQQYYISGATFMDGVNRFDYNDYLLVKLSQKPLKNYNAYYNGWSNDKDDMTNTGVCIHHPAGDIKKISSWDKVIYLPADYWKVKWTNGSAEGGSSGAPLYNDAGYVVGHNSQGVETVCTSAKRNYFGCMHRSWHQYGLSWILNPNGNHTGPNSGSYITSMVGDETCKENWVFNNCNDLHTSANVSYLSPATIGTRQYDGVYNASNQITAGNTTIQTGTTVVFEAGNKIVLNTGFKAEAGSHFVAKIGNCLRGCGNGRATEIPNNELGMVIYDECDESNIIEEEDPDNKNNMPSENAVFVIYPNPSSGVINIELIGINPEDINSISIANSIGVEVYSTNVFCKEINLSDLQVGLYTMSIYYKSDMLTSTFTISK